MCAMADPEDPGAPTYPTDDDADEASEARGVATIDVDAPFDEGAVELDQQVLDQLTDDERSALGDPGIGDEVRATGVRLSPNFLLAEFHCCRGHCAREAVPARAVPALKRLVVEVLQPMRDEFGACSVHSGYRNASHNGHVNGATNSCHRYDARPKTPAADLSFERGNVNQWADFARRRLNRLGNVGGVGRYPGSRFVHVDLGPKRDWNG